MFLPQSRERNAFSSLVKECIPPFLGLLDLNELVEYVWVDVKKGFEIRFAFVGSAPAL